MPKYENLFVALEDHSDEELTELRREMQETLDNPGKLLSFLQVQVNMIDMILRYRKRYKKNKKP